MTNDEWRKKPEAQSPKPPAPRTCAFVIRASSFIRHSSFVISHLNLTALLLAGGQSTRMGRDKAGVCIDGTPLWQRQLDTLLALEPAELLISGRADGPYAGCGVPVAVDELEGRGPLGGIVTALRQMKGEWLLVLAIDLPAMSSAFLSGLIGQADREGRGIVPETCDGMEPVAAIYPRTVLPIAEQCLFGEEHSMRCFVRRAVDAGLVIVQRVRDDNRPLFRNVNTPEDLA
jgi:molybdopterin-guanine dinucleotide biosynthesis protein A